MKLSQARASKSQHKNYRFIDPDQALEILIQGNKEYIASGTSEFDRKTVAHAQHPIAIILTCSDSRVSPELIFNQLHVGTLFIVRNAGNLVNDGVLGSIEYAVKYLNSRLIVVLGHERCGAVTAAIEASLEHKIEHAVHIQNIIETIQPTAHEVIDAMESFDKNSIDQKNKIIKQTAQKNIYRVINQILLESPMISQSLSQSQIKIVGAYYDLDDGTLTILS